MADTIKHQGIVENINGSHVQVKIAQTSACAACSAKGHCTSADTKDKIIDVVAFDAASYRTGDRVWVTGELALGTKAVLLAYVYPFLILVISLFIFIKVWDGHELRAGCCALGLLVPYYFVLWLNRSRLERKLSFIIQPMNAN